LQQFDESEFLCDLTNENKSINSKYTNNKSDSSCFSVEYYLFGDDFNEETSNNDNNTAGFTISNNFNMLTNSTEDNSSLANILAQWALEYRISHTALNSLL